MRKIVFIVINLILMASICFAQTDQFTYHPPTEKKIIDINFITVSSYLILTTIFDLETTFSAIRNGAHEANPIMRPFVKRGRGATYGMQMGINAIVIGTSYLMKKDPKWNKGWWVIPLVVATGHGVAGGLNLKYVW